MPSLQSLSMRLKAVTSTSKITKAMKMVAASKLGRAQKKLDAARPFAAGAAKTMGPILTPGEDYTFSSEMLFAVSSDKGLCGGINSRVVKEVKTRLEQAPEDAKPEVRHRCLPPIPHTRHCDPLLCPPCPSTSRVVFLTLAALSCPAP